MTSSINKIIRKFDLIRITRDTNLNIETSSRDYELIQMVKLRLRDTASYRNNPSHSYWDGDYFHCFNRSRLEVPMPKGTEIKFHDSGDPTRAKLRIRNPELVVSKILGLDLANRQEKRAAKALSSHLQKVFFADITKLDPEAFEIIPDPKSKVKNARGELVLFGQPPVSTDFIQGASFLAKQNECTRWLRAPDNAQYHWIVIKAGNCLTTLSVDDVVVDERMPEYAVRKMSFLLAQGVADEECAPQVLTASIGTQNTDPIDFLIKLADPESSEEKTLEPTTN